jgi:hypothetical protein
MSWGKTASARVAGSLPMKQTTYPRPRPTSGSHLCASSPLREPLRRKTRGHPGNKVREQDAALAVHLGDK